MEGMEERQEESTKDGIKEGGVVLEGARTTTWMVWKIFKRDPSFLNVHYNTTT